LPPPLLGAAGKALDTEIMAAALFLAAARVWTTTGIGPMSSVNSVWYAKSARPSRSRRVVVLAGDCAAGTTQGDVPTEAHRAAQSAARCGKAWCQASWRAHRANT